MSNSIEEEISLLTDRELLKKLDDAEFIAEFERGEKWLLFREAAQRLAAQAEYKLDRINPIEDPTGVTECQVIKKFCRNVLQNIINGIKSEGELAFNEAKARRLRRVLPRRSKK